MRPGERGTDTGNELFGNNRGLDQIASLEQVLPRGLITRGDLDDQRRPGAAHPQRLQDLSRLEPLQAETRDNDVSPVGDRAPFRPGQWATLRLLGTRADSHRVSGLTQNRRESQARRLVGVLDQDMRLPDPGPGLGA